MISAPYSAVLISFLAIAVFSTICGYVLARLTEPWRRYEPEPEPLTDEEVWEWMDAEPYDWSEGGEL